MPKRGPVQLLLDFLRSRRAPGWKLGMAVTLVAALGLLPGEESLYQKASTGLAKSLREAAWKHALAGEPDSKPWPWDQASPSVYDAVPLLGLSAAVHCDDSVKPTGPIPEPSREPQAIDAQDPHLAPNNVAIGDGSANAVKASGGEIIAPSKDQLLEPGAPPVAASSKACALDSSGAFRLMIEAIQARTNPAEIEQKL